MGKMTEIAINLILKLGTEWMISRLVIRILRACAKRSSNNIVMNQVDDIAKAWGIKD